MDGVGARMRERCHQLGISEAEAARRCGISARRFSFYINDMREPKFETLIAICRALATTPNALLGWNNPMEPAAASRQLAHRVRARAVW